MGGWRQLFVNAEPGVQIRYDCAFRADCDYLQLYDCRLMLALACSVLDFGGTGPPLLLCNANGFHALCYLEMVRAI